ncbi:MAG TPA: hypothetical protein VIK95_03045 [Egibacteraceae bacterium]|mgnify:CR=1 FL=1
MGKRLVGALMVVLVCLGCLAVPAFAAEEATEAVVEELPDLEEIGTQTQTSQEFLPEPYEAPPFFRWITYPLLIVGIVALVIIGFLYLRNLPRFAQESKTRRRR